MIYCHSSQLWLLSLGALFAFRTTLSKMHAGRPANHGALSEYSQRGSSLRCTLQPQTTVSHLDFNFNASQKESHNSEKMKMLNFVKRQTSWGTSWGRRSSRCNELSRKHRNEYLHQLLPGLVAAQGACLTLPVGREFALFLLRSPQRPLRFVTLAVDILRTADLFQHIKTTKTNLRRAHSRGPSPLSPSPSRSLSPFLSPSLSPSARLPRQPTHQNHHYALVSSHCRLEKGNIDSRQGLNVFILIPPPSLLCHRQTPTNVDHLSGSRQTDSILQEVEVTD